MRFAKLLGVGVVALLIGACSSEDEGTTEVREVQKKEKVVDSTSIEMVNRIEPLPSPMQIAFMFEKANLEFQDHLVADPNHSQRYLGLISKLLALGTYSADFTYSVLNERGGTAKSYLMVIERMASDVGIANVYNTPQNIRRIEDNIGNFDSLSYILTDIQMEADQYLYEAHDMERGAIIFAGAWLESMFLGVKTTNLDENPQLLDVIVEQEMVLDNLIEHLAAVKEHDLGATDTDVFSSLLSHLREIQAVFDSMDIPEDYSVEVTITRDQLEQLGEQVVNARNYVVLELAGE